MLHVRPRSSRRATGRTVAGAKVGPMSLVVALACALATPLIAQPVAGRGPTETDVAVIVNRDNPIENLSLRDVRDILLGQRTHWSPGRPISLIVTPAPGAIERGVVLRTVLSMDEAAYRKHWVGRVFRAESASAPTNADSLDMIRRAVARIRGAVGVVSRATAAAPDVKVVRINGTLPGDSSYPIR